MKLWNGKEKWKNRKITTYNTWWQSHLLCICFVASTIPNCNIINVLSCAYCATIELMFHSYSYITTIIIYSSPGECRFKKVRKLKCSKVEKLKKPIWFVNIKTERQRWCDGFVRRQTMVWKIKSLHDWFCTLLGFYSCFNISKLFFPLIFFCVCVRAFVWLWAG